MKLKICLTYDFISTKVEKGAITQSKKLDIFGLILEKSNFIVDYTLTNFSQEEFYRLFNFSKIENIYENISLKDLSLESLSYLKNTLKEYDYLVIYELSKNSREILDYLKIKYIDIWLSPIRFYKDILFEFYSNDLSIQNKLNKFRFENNKLFKRAKKIRTYSNVFFDKPKLEKNSCLIIGQMNQDKSIMSDGKFLTLLDFIENLKLLSIKYKKLYLLKHPFMKGEDFRFLKERLTKINNLEVLTEMNTYYLLTRKEIKCVAGISSSVLIESEYFNKKTELFYKPIISDEYIRIYKHFFTSNFWQRIFGLKKKKDFEYFADDNYLRLKYNLIYSYNIFLPTNSKIQFEIKEKYNTIIKLYDFLNKIDLNENYILYGFGSVGKLIYPHLKDNIVAIVDKVLYLKLNFFDGKPIISKDAIDNFEDCKIIVSSFKYKEDISFELKKYRTRIINIDDLSGSI